MHGGGGAVGDGLVRHPDVPVITFTGSRETGVTVLEAAAERLKHVHLELGGKNAIIVMDDADLDLAVDGILWSAFGTSGQRCTAASRVIVHERMYDALSARLVERAEEFRLGPGWEDDTDVGPVINGAALEKIHSYTQIGLDEGATLLTGGEIAARGRLANGFYYRPTTSATSSRACGSRRRRSSGRRSAIRKDEAEAVRVANGVRFGLSSSIFTRDVNRAFRAMRDLEAGIRTSTPGRLALRSTSPSAARRRRATDTARPGRPHSMSSPSGSRSTSTTRARSSARRSTTSSREQRPGGALTRA